MQAAKQFRAIVGPVSWSTAVRFLYARKFDIIRAVALYEQHELTRRREGLINFDPVKEPLCSELKTGKFTVLVTKKKLIIKLQKRLITVNYFFYIF